MLDLRRLRYFVAVADNGGFGRAAEELLVAQSAVSRQVAALEAALGVALLTRSPHAVQLTPEGVALLPRARALLREAMALEDDARALAIGERGEVAIGYSTSAGYATAPLLLDAVRDGLPQVTVRAVVLATPRQPAALLAGEIDVALARCPMPAAGIVTTVVRRERLGVATRAGHRRAALGVVDPADLHDEAIWLHDRGENPGHHDLVVGVCRAAGVEPTVITATSPFDPALRPIADGDAVAIVAESAVDGLPTGLAWRPLRTDVTVAVAVLGRSDERREVVHHTRKAMLAAAAEAWAGSP